MHQKQYCQCIPCLGDIAKLFFCILALSLLQRINVESIEHIKAQSDKLWNLKWNFHSLELSFPEPLFPGSFIPNSEINVDLLFPNYMIIILCDLNPLRMKMLAS